MFPKSPVVPGFEKFEIKVAEHQPEYQTLPALRTSEGNVYARWTLSPEERADLIMGADIVVCLQAGTGPVQPHMLTVVNLKDGDEQFSMKQAKDKLGLVIQQGE